MLSNTKEDTKMGVWTFILFLALAMVCVKSVQAKAKGMTFLEVRQRAPQGINANETEALEIFFGCAFNWRPKLGDPCLTRKELQNVLKADFESLNTAEKLRIVKLDFFEKFCTDDAECKGGTCQCSKDNGCGEQHQVDQEKNCYDKFVPAIPFFLRQSKVNRNVGSVFGPSSGFESMVFLITLILTYFD